MDGCLKFIMICVCTTLCIYVVAFNGWLIIIIAIILFMFVYDLMVMVVGCRATIAFNKLTLEISKIA